MTPDPRPEPIIFVVGQPEPLTGVTDYEKARPSQHNHGYGEDCTELCPRWPRKAEVHESTCAIHYADDVTDCTCDSGGDWLLAARPEPECACGCPDDMHIGEIGCPCGLPDEPPCSEATA